MQRRIEEQKKLEAEAARRERALEQKLKEVKVETPTTPTPTTPTTASTTTTTPTPTTPSTPKSKTPFVPVNNVEPKTEDTKLKQQFSVAFKSNKRSVTEVTKTLGFTDEPEEDTLVPKKRRTLQTLEPDASMQQINTKKLVDQIPTEKEELFSFKIDWQVIDKHDIVEGKMRPWVAKKISEFLGEEEITLIEYICKKLTDHSPPQDIVDQLQLVLDDEATVFVIKMWRMLIYSMLTTSPNTLGSL
eukprot:TRINITY_DN11581_c0_g1_i1.p1 TRINITY_DN11581_c0_g1~~TRINITY_DN11581_c0_g1_i1.p1  ORF type:complete len:245 (-),score=72.47 TRINITY_DN11581_c0_g1_i1:281-1015(-)